MARMRVCELFSTLQGEGLWAGMPMTFIRLQECNLRCPFCDTPQALERRASASWMATPTELAVEVDRRYPEVVCLTGGEPLLQMKGALELCHLLDRVGIPVHLETNGTIGMDLEQCSAFKWITVSPKPPTYKCEIPLGQVSELKLVVCPPLDVAFRNALEYYRAALPEGVPIWLQPDNNGAEALAECMRILKGAVTPPLRLGLSVQMHKLLHIA